MSRKTLVTGASGFIGSTFTSMALDAGRNIVALVRNTDHRNLKRLNTVKLDTYKQSGHLRIVNGDLLGDISGLCEGIDEVVHFAAKTYVDHSIKDSLPFVEANVMGTYRILEDARRHGVKRFIHVSTDEVYGAILNGAYTEDSRINPTNPYAASKAGADALTIAFAHTYGMHTTVTRTENNYGPFQHPQKAIPVFISKAMNNEALPIYGDGKHVRQWLWVEDHVSALLLLLDSNYNPGEVFHVAGNQELTNTELANRIIKTIGKGSIQYIDDHNIRPGHDRRYALNCSKLMDLGWSPKVGIDAGLEKCVEWYRNNLWWLR